MPPPVSDTPLSSPPPVTPARTFWQRRVRDPLVAQLTQGITPEKLALTVAIGSACALFPVIGTTTLLCFLVGLALRLNQPIIQLINQAFWPIHVPVIFLCLRVGEHLFGLPKLKLSVHMMRELLWSDPSGFFHRFGTAVLCAVVGWAVLAPVYCLAVYWIARPIMRGVVRVKDEAIAKKARPAEHPVP